MENKHCYFIDICKFFFTFEVALMHFESNFFYGNSTRIFESGYLAVDFFFVLSGFLLYKSFRSGKYKDAWKYTIRRLKNFMPYAFVVIVSFLCLDAYQIVIESEMTIIGTLNFFVQKILFSLPELLFLQMVFPSQWINFPIWYVSVLLISGLGYYLYLEKKHTVNGGVFLLSIIILGYLSGTYKNIDVHRNITGIFNLPAGLLRGAAEMGIGLFAAESSEKIEHKTVGWTVAGIVVLALILICMVYYPHTQLDYIFILLSAAFIAFEFQDSIMLRIFNKLPGFVSILSLNTYFCHMFVISIWKVFLHKKMLVITNASMWKNMVIYMVLLCVFGFTLETIVNGMKYLTGNRK